MWSLFPQKKRMYIHENNLFEHISHHPKGYISLKEPTCVTFENAILENHVFSDENPGEGFFEVKSFIVTKKQGSFLVTENSTVKELGISVPITELSERKREKIMHTLPEQLEEGIFRNTLIEYHTKKILDKQIKEYEKKPVGYIILDKPKSCTILYLAETKELEHALSSREIQSQQFSGVSEIVQQRIQMKLL